MESALVKNLLSKPTLKLYTKGEDRSNATSAAEVSSVNRIYMLTSEVSILEKRISNVPSAKPSFRICLTFIDTQGQFTREENASSVHIALTRLTRNKIFNVISLNTTQKSTPLRR